jgi:hypothetical protein
LEGDIDAIGHEMRWVLVVSASLMVVVAACSGGPMSGDEYVESLNALVVDAGSDFETSLAAYEQIANPTLEDFIDFVEQQLVFEHEVRDRFDTFDPPDTIDDVNQVMVDTLARIIAAAEGLVEVADTVGSMEELQQTPEFAEYRGVNTNADSMCQEVEAKLNDLSTRPAIDSPWLTDLQRTVRAFLDCDDAGTN